MENFILYNPVKLHFGKDVINDLGKVISTRLDGKFTSGIIVETEAYGGPEDKASHERHHREDKEDEEEDLCRHPRFGRKNSEAEKGRNHRDNEEHDSQTEGCPKHPVLLMRLG